MTDTVTLPLSDARNLIFDALHANGVPDAAAQSVASALVQAEAEGQVGHGFSRLEDYVAQARSGKVNTSAQVSVAQTAPTVLKVDADHGFAYPALDRAIEQGAGIAQTQGTCAMAITRSHHCGALSVQVDRLARQGLIALMVANSPTAIAPWGAGKPLFGTNPIAFAAPRTGQAPLVIDLSLSRVARGKVLNAKKQGQPIPEGWALDADGNPTTDPDAALAGSMVPIGGAKGTVLALMVEILASAMTGAAFSSEASSFFTADGPPPGVGQFLIAMKPAHAGFADRLETLLALIEAEPGARLPGARRAAALERAEGAGVTVPLAYVEAARRLASGTT